ncbi:MAG TPA: PucR family transcriptional regulator, partial [Firmicutes bacterium]|nr:PucR family transcriptional regulator [Bacillota bacterium]
NTEQAAIRLHLHRNTVRYRLDQIRRLLGRDPLAEAFETQMALALRKLL